MFFLIDVFLINNIEFCSNGTGDEKLESVHSRESADPLNEWTWAPTQGIRLSSALVYTCAAALQGAVESYWNLCGLLSSLSIYLCYDSGLASLYKEKSIIEYSLPTDIHTMSCWLFFYQFICAVVFFPLFYLFQGTGSKFRRLNNNLSSLLLCNLLFRNLEWLGWISYFQCL